MTDLRQGSEGRSWALAALAAFAAAAAWSLAEALIFRPGLPAWDQISTLDKLQQASEGMAFPARITSGLLYLKYLQACTAHFGHGALGLWLPQGLLLALECFLLYRRAKKSFGAPAGTAAVLANLLAAESLIRFRSLMSFSALPALLLLIMEGMEQARGPVAALALGILIGLTGCEYDGWIAAYPVLLLFWLSLEKASRPKAAWLSLGLALGAGWVLWESRSLLGDYASKRLLPQAQQGASAPWRDLAAHLKSYFRGRGFDLYLGETAAWPFWSWPLLLAGIGACWKAKARLWIYWAGLGLLPLASASAQSEAHRAIAAAPAFSLLCGGGAAWIWSALSGRPRLRAAALSLLFGAGLSLTLSSRCDQVSDQISYRYWDSLSQAARFLRQRQTSVPLKVLSDLNDRSMGEARFAFPADSAQASETWALLPDRYALRQDAALGDWIEFRPRRGDETLVLLRLRGDQAGLFTERERFLRELWRSLPKDDSRRHMQAMLGLLKDPEFSDPWLRRACLDHYLREGAKVRASVRELAMPVLSEKDPSPFALATAAAALAQADPRLALRLALRAQALDPARPSLASLAASLQAAVAALDAPRRAR